MKTSYKYWVIFVWCRMCVTGLELDDTVVGPGIIFQKKSELPVTFVRYERRLLHADFSAVIQLKRTVLDHLLDIISKIRHEKSHGRPTNNLRKPSTEDVRADASSLDVLEEELSFMTFSIRDKYNSLYKFLETNLNTSTLLNYSTPSIQMFDRGSFLSPVINFAYNQAQNYFTTSSRTYEEDKSSLKRAVITFQSITSEINYRIDSIRNEIALILMSKKLSPFAIRKEKFKHFLESPRSKMITSWINYYHLCRVSAITRITVPGVIYGESIEQLIFHTLIPIQSVYETFILFEVKPLFMRFSLPQEENRRIMLDSKTEHLAVSTNRQWYVEMNNFHRDCVVVPQIERALCLAQSSFISYTHDSSCLIAAFTQNRRTLELCPYYTTYTYQPFFTHLSNGKWFYSISENNFVLEQMCKEGGLEITKGKITLIKGNGIFSIENKCYALSVNGEYKFVGVGVGVGVDAHEFTVVSYDSQTDDFNFSQTQEISRASFNYSHNHVHVIYSLFILSVIMISVLFSCMYVFYKKIKNFEKKNDKIYRDIHTVATVPSPPSTPPPPPPFPTWTIQSNDILEHVYDELIPFTSQMYENGQYSLPRSPPLPYPRFHSHPPPELDFEPPRQSHSHVQNVPGRVCGEMIPFENGQYNQPRSPPQPFRQPQPESKSQPQPQPEPEPEPDFEPQRQSHSHVQNVPEMISFSSQVRENGQYCQPRSPPQPFRQSHPQPEPESKSQPQPQPQPESKPQPQAEPEPDFEPQRQSHSHVQNVPEMISFSSQVRENGQYCQPRSPPQPYRQSHPQPEPEPEPEPQPQPQPESQPQPQPQPQPESQPQPQPEPRRQSHSHEQTAPRHNSHYENVGNNSHAINTNQSQTDSTYMIMNSLPARRHESKNHHTDQTRG